MGNGTAQIRSARDWDEHHQAHTAIPAHLNEMAVRRAHRIAADILGPEPPAAAALDRIVELKHHGAVRHEGVDNKFEQDAAVSARAPRGAVEDAVDVHESPLLRGP